MMNSNVVRSTLLWFLFLLLLAEVSAFVVVCSVDDPVDPAITLKVQEEGRIDERRISNSRNKWMLLIPFRGLPMNGRFADATGWVLWLTDTDPGQIKVKPDDLADAARRFQFSPGIHAHDWRWLLLRQMYAFTGTDLPNTLVLSVLYALAWHAASGYRARHAQCRSIAEQWNWSPAFLQHLFGTSQLAREPLDKLCTKLIEFADEVLLAPTASPTAILAARTVRTGAFVIGATRLGAVDRFKVEDDLRARVRELVDADDETTADLDYFAQAIPPLGFIGTVLGIGEAMIATRNLAAGGGLSEVAAALGVAFNTTFVALALFLCVEYLGMQSRRDRARLVRGITDFFGSVLLPMVGTASTPPLKPSVKSPTEPTRPPGTGPTGGRK